MIDPHRINQWADTCQALLDDINDVMSHDTNVHSLAKALTDPSAGGLETIMDQANVHGALDRAADAIKGAQLYFEAAIHRTPSPRG